MFFEFENSLFAFRQNGRYFYQEDHFHLSQGTHSVIPYQCNAVHASSILVVVEIQKVQSTNCIGHKSMSAGAIINLRRTFYVINLNMSL